MKPTPTPSAIMRESAGLPAEPVDEGAAALADPRPRSVLSESMVLPADGEAVLPIAGDASEPLVAPPALPADVAAPAPAPAPAPTGSLARGHGRIGAQRARAGEAVGKAAALVSTGTLTGAQIHDALNVAAGLLGREVVEDFARTWLARTPVGPVGPVGTSA